MTCGNDLSDSSRFRSLIFWPKANPNLAQGIALGMGEGNWLFGKIEGMPHLIGQEQTVGLRLRGTRHPALRTGLSKRAALWACS